MKSMSYKGHEISLCSVETIKREWVPEAKIFLSTGGEIKEQEISAKKGFTLKSESDANDHAGEQAIKWIDENASS